MKENLIRIAKRLGFAPAPRGQKRGQQKKETLGKRGETFARCLIESQGLTVLSANFRVPRGEVDLIARDGKTVVFIEVKTRATRKFGEPFEAVGLPKQRRIIGAAEAYLQRLDPLPPCRFDVISVFKKGPDFEAEWIRDAFEMP